MQDGDSWFLAEEKEGGVMGALAGAANRRLDDCWRGGLVMLWRAGLYNDIRRRLGCLTSLQSIAAGYMYSSRDLSCSH